MVRWSNRNPIASRSSTHGSSASRKRLLARTDGGRSTRGRVLAANAWANDDVFGPIVRLLYCPFVRWRPRIRPRRRLIQHSEYLYNATRCSVGFNASSLGQIAPVVSAGLLSTILQIDFGEQPFHALG